MKEVNYKKYNAANILIEVDILIDELEKTKIGGYTPKYIIEAVYQRLNIFDWWTDTLSLSRLKDMRKFLKEAIKLGFTGYVCFKVGVTGCANGMWAYKETTTTGYSPDGPCLYKSFTPAYEYWSINFDGKVFLPEDDEYDKLKTIKQLEDFIKENNLMK